MKEEIQFDLLFDKIGSVFEWNKVYKTMKALDWCWSMGDGKMGIPNTDTLKQRARQLLREVYDRKSGRIGTGGF